MKQQGAIFLSLPNPSTLIRAGIFVGVDQTGDLPRLADAANGAMRMHRWAAGQGMVDPDYCRLITDSNQAVEPGMILDAIHKLTKGPGVDQLILYYAGHGTTIRRNEVWLLSEAPTNAGAAVNVSGTVELARYNGAVQHTIIISDACRTAAAGVRAQSVTGVEVFPNVVDVELSRPVDQLYACGLGRTAAELMNMHDAAPTYTGVYTDALLEALSGNVHELLESVEGDADRYVMVRNLTMFLRTELPRRLHSSGHKGVRQAPDAIITSDKKWIARLPSKKEGFEGLLLRAKGIGRQARKHFRVTSPGALPADAASMGLDLLRRVAESDPRQVENWLIGMREGSSLSRHFADTVESLRSPSGVTVDALGCAVNVRGSHIEQWLASGVGGQLDQNGTKLTIERMQGQSARTAVLTVDGGIAVLVPLIQGVVTVLTMMRGNLINIGFEGVGATINRSTISRSNEGRLFGAIAAAANLHGRFALEAPDVYRINERVRSTKWIDPTFAIYASYAFHDLQRTDDIREISRYVLNGAGHNLFDLALLSRRLVGRQVDSSNTITPFLPMLPTGFALLRAHNVLLPKRLNGIERHVTDSPWTTYHPDGIPCLVDAIAAGEVR